MQTTHRVYFENSGCMKSIPSESVDLIVTSPPYPMIAMWDDLFSDMDSDIKSALERENGPLAFERMHEALDPAWDETWRVLKPGGIACINIGDGARTIRKNFALYTNHSRILTHMLRIGFSALPAILWRKQTNAPNKFMGSGMLPPGAYVTLEHEYILILRKGPKREFKTAEEKENRRESAIFWEERNVWFSDVWMDLKGVRQHLSDESARGRTAAFPFEVPHRLINMFSVKGDTVVDPFVGVGTTLAAAMAAGRNSIGFEIDEGLRDVIVSRAETVKKFSNDRIRERIRSHKAFVEERVKVKGELKYTNARYGFPVISRQEKDLFFNPLIKVDATADAVINVAYSGKPQLKPPESGETSARSRTENSPSSKKASSRPVQRTLPI